jgi:hypothetical protein
VLNNDTCNLLSGYTAQQFELIQFSFKTNQYCIQDDYPKLFEKTTGHIKDAKIRLHIYESA